jgi:thiol:disulfide interchange protein DsbA
MVKSVFSLSFLLLLAAVGIAAEPPKGAAAKEGEGYELINPPQPTADPGKVEVIEFFWYGCPHCYHFEPDINAWLKTKPDNVTFIRQPAIFNAHWAAHAKAYFTAEALGAVEKMHADFYNAIQNQKRALETEDDLAKFFAEHGVSETDFRKAYKSFAVDTKMRQAESMAARYGVTGTPSLAVNGKYRIGGSTAKSFSNMITVMNTLIKQESAKKTAK